MYGVAIQSIDEVIRASLVGLTVSQFRDETGEDYPIIVRYQGHEPMASSVHSEYRPEIEDFNFMVVKSASGQLIPILLWK